MSETWRGFGDCLGDDFFHVPKPLLGHVQLRIDLHDAARLHFLNAVKDAKRSWNIGQREISLSGFSGDRSLGILYRENRFDLRSEAYLLAADGIVQRLFSQPIASEQNRIRHSVP